MNLKLTNRLLEHHHPCTLPSPPLFVIPSLRNVGPLRVRQRLYLQRLQRQKYDQYFDVSEGLTRLFSHIELSAEERWGVRFTCVWWYRIEEV